METMLKDGRKIGGGGRTEIRPYSSKYNNGTTYGIYLNYFNGKNFDY